ncbi:hypothetical protein GALL_165390 [mine drainage metagenome]|uniref:Uncharacterized protein n=1 Tax=mine drainage metagenome TaxID=410659 RepID=A0A1J5SBM8_9ZZZZ
MGFDRLSPNGRVNGNELTLISRLNGVLKI